MINIVIGQGTTTDDLTTADWANGPYVLDITVNGEEGINYAEALIGIGTGTVET